MWSKQVFPREPIPRFDQYRELSCGAEFVALRAAAWKASSSAGMSGRVGW
jgi:hypothetical protein